MGEDQQKQSGKRSGTDRWVKIGFLAVLVVGGLAVYMRQRHGPQLKDWGEDLPSALAQAQEEGRRVLLFAMSHPPSQIARRLAATTIRKNGKAIRQHNLILVKITLSSSLQSGTARRYRIKKLPTMLLLDSKGNELNRREGFIGEVEFRRDFLQPKRR